MGEVRKDGGWAWMIMIAVMITSFMENGVFKSFGIFFVAYVERFDSKASVTSVISGTFFGIYSISALLMMTIGLRYLSSRQSVAIGGLCVSIGYLLCAFADRIEYLIVAQGVLTGIGSAFTTGPGLVILGRYFDKRRGLANGLALAFGSMGALAVPPLFQSLVVEYDFTGALLVTSGLLLNILVGASLMRPIPNDHDQTELLTKNECDKHNEDYHVTMETEQLYDPLIRNLQEEEIKTDRFSRNYKKANETASMSQSCGTLNGNIKPGFAANYRTQNSKSLDIVSNSNVLKNVNFSNLSIPSLLADETRKDTAISKDNIKFRMNRFKTFYGSIIADISRLKNPLYVILLATFCIGGIGCGTAHVFIPPFAHEMGVTRDGISIIAVILGGTDFLGRLVFALIADYKHVQRYQLIMVALFFVGVAMQFAPVYKSFASFIVLSVIYGLFGGIMITFYASVLVDFIGYDSFETGLGLMTSIQGIVLATATPFVVGNELNSMRWVMWNAYSRNVRLPSREEWEGLRGLRPKLPDVVGAIDGTSDLSTNGYLKDATGTYKTSFHFLGTCVLIAAGLLLFVPLAKRHIQKQKLKEHTIDTENDIK